MAAIVDSVIVDSIGFFANKLMIVIAMWSLDK